ncbi:MAG: hypothetical protein V3S54_01990 [Woeseiaceae bacterium]
MESIHVTLNDRAAFDQAVNGDASLVERGDLEIITVDDGTKDGNPAAVITFSVRLPNNEGGYRAQAVTTVRALAMALSAIQGRYRDRI